MIWKLALQYFFRHWRLNLVLLIIMILGSAFLAGIPMVAVTIAGESLSQSLESAPVHVRNLIIEGKSRTDEPPEDVEQSVSSLLKEIMAVREGLVAAFPLIHKADGTEFDLFPATLVLDLRSYDLLQQRVRMLDGRLPDSDPVPVDAEMSPIFEAAIGVEAARRSGLAIGDLISPVSGSYHLIIVGIVEPLDPNAEIWWEDSQMLPFSAWRRVSISPDIDEWNISLLLHPGVMASRIRHNQFWRVILDHREITASNAPAVRETLTRLQSRLSEEGLVLNTGLIDLIVEFESALAQSRVSLLLLTFQSLIAVFYLVGIIGSFLVEQSRQTLATLLGRGFNRGQITGIFARASILLVILSAVVAPWVAHWSLGFWNRRLGVPAPDTIPAESWWLALSTGLFSWITLIFSVYRATGDGLLTGQGQGLRLEHRRLDGRQLIWDSFILVLGGLAYWQLMQGSAVTRGAGSERTLEGISDPVLLLGPTILLLAVGLILIRLLPFAWRLFSWASKQTRGLFWALGFSRLARQPAGASKVILLISLTAGLSFFASVFTTSIENWQQTMARYLAGADIRLIQPLLESTDGDVVSGSPDISARTQVIHTRATFLVNEYQRMEFELFALDPAIFPSVVSYPSGISPFSIEQIMGALQSESSSILPVVISSNTSTRDLDLGDRITLEMGKEAYPFEVVGIIVHFPAAKGNFAITDQSRFVQHVDLESIDLTGRVRRELWINVVPGKHEKVFAALVEAGLADSMVGTSRAQLEVIQSDLIFREVTTAFELNASVLIPLSVVGFLLIQLFAFHRRAAEFNILQALGLSRSQLRGMLLFEGFMLVALGLFVGAGIGFALAITMQPFLAQILPEVVGGFILNEIMIDWPEMNLRLVTLLFFYGFALLALIVSADRMLQSARREDA